MAGIVTDFSLEWGLGAEGDPAPRSPGSDRLAAANDVVTTDSRKSQQKLGKLANQGHHAAHSASLDLLPETARPPGPDDPLRGLRLEHSPRLATGVCKDQEPLHASGRGCGTRCVSYPQQG